MEIEPGRINEISQIVFDLLEKSNGNRDPFTIADNLGIKFCFKSLRTEVPAFSLRTSESDIGTIFINSNYKSSYARKILCAHELGHLCLHKDDDANLFDTRFDPIKEYEANRFATILLPQLLSLADTTNMSVEDFNNYMLHKIN